VAKTPTSKKTPTKGSSGRPAGLFTWIAIALVVVVVATLVIIKVTSGNSSNGTGVFQPTDAATAAQVTGVPAATFDNVAINSPVAPISPPIPLKGQPSFTTTTSAGTLPTVFYLGAEYCPYCAAERWPLIVALGRFGTFSNLGDMESSTQPGEPYPGTPTFTFVKSTYTSKYLVFRSIEQYTNVPDASTNFYTTLQNPSKEELANFKKYDTSKWIPNITSNQNYSIPYLTIDNKYIVSGSSYTPATLASLTRSQIAQGLSDPTSPVTDAIVATANYLSAAICVATKDQPTNVCTSTGVMAAKKAMGIK